MQKCESGVPEYVLLQLLQWCGEQLGHLERLRQQHVQAAEAGVTMEKLTAVISVLRDVHIGRYEAA